MEGQNIMLDVSKTAEWLLEQADPWVVLNTRRDLLGQRDDAPEVKRALYQLKKDPRVNELLEEVKVWPPRLPLGRAYDPKDSLWKLSILADFGLTREDKRVAQVSEKIFANQATAPAPSGFLHGGFDHTKSWDKKPYVCISHVMTYALARFGYLGDQRLEKAYDYLTSWQRLDGGWHPTEACLAGNERENDPSCPFGTVNVLRAIAVHPKLKESKIAAKGVAHILNVWERRAEPYRPVGFGMGSTFDRLQYPFVQHQLLKTVDTLSNFSVALSDKRFAEMLARVASKVTADGFYKAEGINKPYAEFDFGQKKTSSPWITFIVARAVHRHEQAKTNGSRKKTKIRKQKG
jgi:hypothetical protein